MFITHRSAVDDEGTRWPGDIIRKVDPNHTPVASPGQVKAEIDKAVETRRKSVLMLIESA
jgi:hypothetical protein